MAQTRSLLGMTLIAAMLLAGSQLHAQVKQPIPENVVSAMSVKLLRGVVNVLTCPLEIPRQIDRHIAQRGTWEGSCVGFVAGLGMTVFRGVAGGLEAVSFMVPFPEDYESLNTPAFAWDDWGAPVKR